MTSKKQPNVKFPIHPSFDAGNADLIVQGSDGVMLKLHRKYLETGTGAFPGAEFDSQGETTYLTETSEVLSILFQFVYPKRHPDLREVDFDLVAAVAEASEKYEVYAAMNICQLRMREFLPSRAAEILNHAVKHGYYGLMDEVIPHIARQPLIEVLEKLPPDRFIAWCRYHETWEAIFERALSAVRNLDASREYDSLRSISKNKNICIHNYCSICATCRWSLMEWIARLKSITILSHLEASISEACRLTKPVAIEPKSGRDPICDSCGIFCMHRASIAEQIASDSKKIPSFKTFL